MGIYTFEHLSVHPLPQKQNLILYRKGLTVVFYLIPHIFKEKQCTHSFSMIKKTPSHGVVCTEIFPSNLRVIDKKVDRQTDQQ